MKWNQPPKKTVKAEFADNMSFIKPTHGDDPKTPSIKEIKQSTFNPHQSEHRLLDKHSMDNLLCHVLESIPNTDLQQFWESNTSSDSSINHETLQRFVIFSHAHASSMAQHKFYDLTMPQCYDHLHNVKLLPNEASAIEEGTGGQSANELWFILRNGRLTSSKLEKFLIHKS